MAGFFQKYRPEITGALICLTLGTASGLLGQTGNSAWYASLNKPNFNPPNWLFGPVWTVLYIMMGIALGKIWRDRKYNKSLLIAFIIQFALNLAWTPLFFYLKLVGWALFDISLLWLFILLVMALAYRKRLIFLLFLPYIGWVSFAFALNLSILKLNYIF